MRPAIARIRAPRWTRRWPLLLGCLACDTLLGLEQGVPAPDTTGRSGAGARAVAADGGEGSGKQPLTGGVAGSDAPGGTQGESGEGGDTSAASGHAGRGAGGASGAGVTPSGGSSPAGGAGPPGGTGGNGAGTDGAGRGACGSDSDCENPDALHCRVACRKSACVTAPLDSDGDEHADQRCLAAPGDDCDDTRSSVLPGATEVCDGLDNDCSGTRDLEDGLPLAGANATLWAHHGVQPALAYSAQAERFGLTWREAIDDASPGNAIPQSLHYAFTDLDGTVTGAGSIPLELVTDVAIATAAGEFALLWATLSGAFFQRLTPDGMLLGERVEVTADYARFVALAHTTLGGWTAFWQEPLAFRVRRVGTSGELGQAFQIGDGDTVPIQAVASGQTILFAGQSAGRDLARIVPSSLVGGDYVQFGTPGRDTVQAQLAARDDGFGVASVDGGNVIFKSFDSNGYARCGPVVLPERPFYFTIAPSPSGYVILGGQSLVEVTLDCVVLQHTSRPENAIPGEPKAVSAGDGGYLVAWRDWGPSDTPTHVGWRRFGPHFCD